MGRNSRVSSSSALDPGHRLLPEEVTDHLLGVGGRGNLVLLLGGPLELPQELDLFALELTGGETMAVDALRFPGQGEQTALDAVLLDHRHLQENVDGLHERLGGRAGEQEGRIGDPGLLLQTPVDHAVVHGLHHVAPIVPLGVDRPPRKLVEHPHRGARHLPVLAHRHQRLHVIGDRESGGVRPAPRTPAWARNAARSGPPRPPGSKSPTAITAIRSGRYQRR